MTLTFVAQIELLGTLASIPASIKEAAPNLAEEFPLLSAQRLSYNNIK